MMGNIVKLNIKTLVSISIIVISVLAISIVEKVNLLFAIVMIMWAGMFSYAVLSIKYVPFLFCFLVSFFVFLLGRQLCYHYLHIDQVYEFLNVVNDRTYVCLIVSFIGLATGLFVSSKIRIVNPLCDQVRITDYGNNQRSYQIATKIVFYLCYAGTVVATLMQIVFVKRVGYLESYTVEAGGAGIPTIVSYLSRFTPVVFCLYLATKPPKKSTIITLLLYEGYAVLTLMTGQRYPFIGNSMLILIYFILRGKQEKGWIKKYYFVFLLIAIPVLMLFMTAYDALRLGASFSIHNFFEAFEDFFIQQGGSVNVIRRTIYNADQLNDMHMVSFQSVYSAVFENAIVRRLLSIKTYSGNSIEHALYTNSLPHRLSYIAYGSGYLQGKGTGSSYIAELLHDFSMIGVFGGNVIYGILLKKIDRIDFLHSFGDGIKLAMIYSLLLAPRGGFDSFIGNVFNLQTIIGLFMVFFVTKAVNGYEIRLRSVHRQVYKGDFK